MNAASSGRASVERHAEDLWRIWPADETWLRLLAARALLVGGVSARSAVVKEHPQHEGVLLQGPLEGLQGAACALRTWLRALPLACPIVLPDFASAALVRRAVMTRVVCLAADAVAFTDEVENLELEPQAAHRLGQLAFWAEEGQLRRHEDLPLLVPRGKEALARHLCLPSGVRLNPSLLEVRLGICAKSGKDHDDPALLARVTLEAGSVHTRGHAKYMAVTSPSYRPRWRLADASAPEVRDLARRHGVEISPDGVLPGSARREVLERLGLKLLETPAGIELDYESLSFERKEAALASAVAELLLEIERVEAQLDQPVRTDGWRCPDVPSSHFRRGDMV